jgi:hypothetical protein
MRFKFVIRVRGDVWIEVNGYKGMVNKIKGKIGKMVWLKGVRYHKDGKILCKYSNKEHHERWTEANMVFSNKS